MCGIFGVVNGNTFVDQKLCSFVEQAMVTGSLRGEHSTGILQINKQGKVFVDKAPLPGYEFKNSKGVQAYINDVDMSPITLVHNRHATRGAISYENAHPFNIYIGEKGKPDSYSLHGVHNGSLSSFPTNSRTFDVDSEWALDLIAREGVDAFKKFNGSFCFVWFDSRKPDKLMMARNTDRPMHYAYTGTKRMLFASEHGMLSWLMDRNYQKINDNKVYMLEPGQVYEIDVNDPSQMTKVPFPAFVSQYAASRPVAPVAPASGSTCGTGSSSCGVSSRKGRMAGNNDVIGRAIRPMIKDELDAIFLKSRKEQEKDTTKVSAAGNLNEGVKQFGAILEAEREEADLWGCRGVHAEFTPIEYVEADRSLIGSIDTEEFGEFDAVMRSVDKMMLDTISAQLDSEKSIHVIIRGMMERPEGMAIVSWPHPRTAEQQADITVRNMQLAAAAKKKEQTA